MEHSVTLQDTWLILEYKLHTHKWSFIYYNLHYFNSINHCSNFTLCLTVTVGHVKSSIIKIRFNNT